VRTTIHLNKEYMFPYRNEEKSMHEFHLELFAGVINHN